MYDMKRIHYNEQNFRLHRLELYDLKQFYAKDHDPLYTLPTKKTKPLLNSS